MLQAIPRRSAQVDGVLLNHVWNMHCHNAVSMHSKDSYFAAPVQWKLNEIIPQLAVEFLKFQAHQELRLFALR